MLVFFWFLLFFSRLGFFFHPMSSAHVAAVLINFATKVDVGYFFTFPLNPNCIVRLTMMTGETMEKFVATSRKLITVRWKNNWVALNYIVSGRALRPLAPSIIETS